MKACQMHVSIEDWRLKRYREVHSKQRERRPDLTFSQWVREACDEAWKRHELGQGGKPGVAMARPY